MALGQLRWLWRPPAREVAPPEAYAAWAPRYPPRAHNRFMEIEERAVLGRLPDVRGLTVVDLGCGSGRYAAILARRGAARVIGLDSSPEMLARARRLTTRLVRGDLRALPLQDGAADLAICGLAIGDIAELDTALAGIARLLKPGGCAVYSDLHPRGAEAGWRRTFTDARGRRLAVRHCRHSLDDHTAACHAAGLLVESIDEPVIDFGHEFQGWPAVLVVTARKRVHKVQGARWRRPDDQDAK